MGRRAKPIEFDGRTYTGGIPELSKIYGIGETTIRSRRKKGWSWREALGLEPGPKASRSDAVLLEIDGVSYDAAEAGRFFKVSGPQPGHKIRKRKALGWTDRQAVGLDLPPRRRIKKKRQYVNDRSYPIPEGVGTVYLITNLINQKRYIGITASSFQHRQAQYRSEHKSSEITRPIIRAMRKYGYENFRFEAIDQSATTYPELLALEAKYIAQFDTYHNGYNATSGGEIGGRPITVKGVEYPSVAVAALAHGLEPYHLVGRMRSGMTPNEAVDFEFRKQYTVNDPQSGNVSGTLAELCRLYNFPFHRAYQRLQKGWTADQVFGFEDHDYATLNDPIVIGGETYSSFRHACNEIGISYKLAWRRHKKRGWTLEQAFGLDSPPRSARHGGQKIKVGKRTFTTKTAAMRALGISYNKLMNRIADGTYILLDS